MKINVVSEDSFALGGVRTVVEEQLRVMEEDGVEYVMNGSPDCCDLLHAHTVGPGTVWKAAQADCPTMITAHVIPKTVQGHYVMDSYLKPFTTKYLSYVYNRFDKVIALSGYLRDRLASVGVEEDKLEVIPNGIDTDRYSFSEERAEEFREKHGLEDTFLALSVGQFVPRKGVKTFYRVAKRMPDADFLWAGERPYGPLHAGQLEMKKIREEAPDNAHFPGFVDDIVGAYSAADVFFFPSHQDNFPMVVLEAAACGRPLVLRDIPEYDNIFGDYALFASDEEGFAQRLEALRGEETWTRHHELAEELSEKYRAENVMEDYYRLVEKICGESI